MPAVPAESVIDDAPSVTRFPSPFGDHVAFVVVHERDRDLPPLLDAEQALISPRASPKYALDLSLGRAAARLALRQLGVPDSPISRGPNREPVWPTGFVGTISHAGGYALAAVAPSTRCGGLGIDVERRVDMRDITDRIAIPEEQRWLQTLAPETRQRHALQLFSAKESVFKAFYPQVRAYFGFECAHLRWDARAEAFNGQLLPPLHEVRGAVGFRVSCRWSGDLVLTALELEL